ncbi:MAG: hypothetical protein RSB59_00135 [Clostridia bacterium]
MLIFKFNNSQFEDGFLSVLISMYSSFGVLAFEGLSEFEIGFAYLQCLYVGTSVCAGMVFVSVITAKANYEIYSRIIIYFNKISTHLKKKTDIYIFTALTEDSITLARSIKAKYSENHFELKELKQTTMEKVHKRALIVFAGSELSMFNRKNELCREVMADGFLYWSYAKSNNKSIAKSLRLNNRNKKNFNVRFVVLAFALDEKGIPKEEANMDVVFSDIKTRIAKEDNLRIEYLILTKREINYQAYDRSNRELLWEYAMAHQTEFFGAEILANDVEFLNELKQYFMESKREQARRIGEADNQVKELAKNLKDTGKQVQEQAEKLVQELAEKLKQAETQVKELAEKTGRYKRIYKKVEGEFALSFAVDIFNEAMVVAHNAIDLTLDKLIAQNSAFDNEPLLIWSLGFGETSQAIVDQLYIQAVNVDEENIAQRFTVEAFDPNMHDLSGLFQFDHPFYACINTDNIADCEIEQLKTYLNGKSTAELAPINKEGCATIQEIIDLLYPIIRRAVKVNKSKKKLDEVKKMYEASIKDFCKNSAVITKTNTTETNTTEATTTEAVINNASLTTANIIKEICFPVYRFNKVSCLDLSFFERIDKISGKQFVENEKLEKVVNALKDIVEKDSSIASEKMKTLLDSLDILNGAENNFKKFAPNRPKILVVATGDDFRNIQLANAIINDIQNEVNLNVDGKKQILIVNIRDKTNNSLLINANKIWQNNVLELNGLTVFVVGNSTDIYFCKNVIEHAEEAERNFGYNDISQKIGNCDGFKPNMITSLKERYLKLSAVSSTTAKDEKDKETTENNCKNEDIDKLVKESFAILSNLKMPSNDIEKDWMKIDVFLKESNRSTKSYGKALDSLYKKYKEEMKVEEAKKTEEAHNAEAEKNAKEANNTEVEKNAKEANVNYFSRLCMLEHQRWVRFHLANGWIFKNQKYKDELLKCHHCIVPYFLVPDDTVVYDFTNIIYAIKDNDIEDAEGDK